MRSKILEFETKAKEFESHTCKSHLIELESIRQKANDLLDENRNLKATIIINKMLEDKIKNYEHIIRELQMSDSENNYQSHLGEMKLLKIKIQNLKTENLALKSPKNIISLDFDEIDRMVKNCHYPHNKSGAGYKRRQSFLEFNNPQSLNQKRNTQKVQIIVIKHHITMHLGIDIIKKVIRVIWYTTIQNDQTKFILKDQIMI